MEVSTDWWKLHLCVCVCVCVCVCAVMVALLLSCSGHDNDDVAPQQVEGMCTHLDLE